MFSIAQLSRLTNPYGLMTAGAGLAMLTANYNSKIKSYNFEYFQNHDNIKLANSMDSLFSTKWRPNMMLSADPLLQFIYLGKVHRKSVNVQYDRTYVKTTDGGQISLDFNQTNNYKDNGKMMVIIHGLVGGSESTYIKHLAQSAAAKGMNSVVYQSRGTNGTKLLNPKLNHPSVLEDYKIAFKKLKEMHPEQELYVVGFSMGGNFLVRLLAEESDKIDVKAAAAVSPPFDVNHAVDFIEGGVYENHFLEMFKMILFKNNEMIKKMEEIYGYSYDKMMESKKLRELHQELSCKVFGEDDTEKLFDKYRITGEHLERIETPTLIMQAQDDPICSVEKVLKEDIKKNRNLFYAETNVGAHICWLNSGGVSEYPKPFYDQVLLKYFSEIDSK